MANTDISIVIVSWNVKELLQKCLASIYKHQGKLKLEIIVIDNASDDGTADMVKVNYPQVDLVTNINNLGFAAANNIGILRSHGEFILFLNPDTEIIKNTLNQMVEFMKQNYQIGIAGCKHLNKDWTLQPSVRRFPTYWSLFFIFTKLYKIFPNIPSVHHYLAKDLNYKIAQPVEQVAGSFLMIRYKTLEEIGPFDERFFLWFEEVDLCKRTHEGGWQVWYNPDAEIIHFGGQSFNQQMTWKNQKIFWKSAWHYLKKHKPKK